LNDFAPTTFEQNRQFITKSLVWLIFVLALPLAGTSQTVPRVYDRIAFDKRASFGKLPPNWTFADSVAIHPDKAAPLKVFPGNTVLVGKVGENTTLSTNARNLKLYLIYTLSPKASARILLPGGGFVLLSEGHSVSPEQQTGYTGQIPIQDAGKLAGLAQTMEIDYESDIPNMKGRARINELKINGVTVQQGQYLPANGSSPITIEVLQGTAVFKAIGLQKFDQKEPVALANLTYKIYNDAWDSRTTDKLAHSGQSPGLTCEVAEGKKSYNLVYEGDLVIKEKGDYNFTTIYTGAYCQLSIEGNVVLDTDQSTSQETHLTNVRLEEGTHKLKLWYSKLPWMPSALGLRVGKSGVRDYDLHERASLPEPPAKPFIEAAFSEGKAEMIRSFLQLPSEKHKRTHCLSVGTPAGRHYSVDLNRAAFLQVWSGEFVNATELWHERAELQLLSPLGMAESISGRSSFARLSDQNSPWVDSSAINFLNYRINKEGYPTFRYALGPSIIEDAIVANQRGITRTITPERNASANNHVLLAEGKRIYALDKGLYVVDGKYYIQTNNGKTPIVRTIGGKTELLLPIATPVSYSILW
jgi:hypothetical protein